MTSATDIWVTSVIFKDYVLKLVLAHMLNNESCFLG
jgi:hypothetical protein